MEQPSTMESSDVQSNAEIERLARLRVHKDTTQIIRKLGDPARWSVQSVLQWLAVAGIKQYGVTFEASQVTGDKLLTLTDELLQTRIGMTNEKHRVKAETYIHELREVAAARQADLAVASANSPTDKWIADNTRRMQARRDFWTPGLRAVVAEQSSELYGSPMRKATHSPAKGGNASVDGTRSEAVSPSYVGRHSPPSSSRDRIALQRTTGSGISQRPHSAPIRRPQPPAPGATGVSKGSARPLRPMKSTTSPTGSPTLTQGPVVTERSDQGVPLQKMMTSVLSKLRQKYGQPRRVDLRSPEEKLEALRFSVRNADAQGDLEGVTALWVEQAALARIVHGDVSMPVVQAQFNLGTNYLRRRMVAQAAAHFNTAKTTTTKLGDTDGALKFEPRILEGLGICETRLGHLLQATALLDKALRLNEELHGAEHVSGTSIWVAKSELHCAKGEFQDALDCLEEAWMRKEADVGNDNVQVAKLEQAMARVRQRQIKVVKGLIAQVAPTLRAALDVKAEYEAEQRRSSTDGGATDARERAQFQQLLSDIGEMESKHSRLVEAMRAAQGDALKYMAKAHRTFEHALGSTHATVIEAARNVYEFSVQYDDAAMQEEYQQYRPNAEGKTI